jgi:nitrile hydratase
MKEEGEEKESAAQSLGYYRRLQAAVEELLVMKGLFSGQEIDRQIRAMDERDHTRGARMVARAWLDQGYRARLLKDGASAAEEMGFAVGPLKLVVVENMPTLHNVIVCTLCSCYPRALLGIPPDWYKSREYRSRVVREPRKVLAEFGLELPPGTDVRVHDSTAELRYMVLPLRPQGTDGLGEEALAQLVTRDSLVGVGVPRSPALSAPLS